MEKVLDNDFANINSVSGIGVVFCYVLFYFIFYEKKYKYIPFTIINVFIIAASGSRKSLIFSVSCFLIIIIINFKNKNFLLNMIKGIILAIFFSIVVKLILQMPAFEMLNTRIGGLVASFTRTWG